MVDVSLAVIDLVFVFDIVSIVNVAGGEVKFEDSAVEEWELLPVPAPPFVAVDINVSTTLSPVLSTLSEPVPGLALLPPVGFVSETDVGF